MKLEINKKMLPMKAHYFLFNAGQAPIMPFIPTYARQLGVSQVGVGLMYTIFPFVGLLSKPFFGAIADKFKIGKIIFMMAIFCAACFYGSIGFIPAKPTEASLDLDCGMMTLLKTCDITDNCTLEKINMEHEENNIMECSLFCEPVSRTFLDQMCNGWNVSSACPPDVKTVEMTTYSNMSKALYQQNCLYFPIDMVFVDDQKIEHPTCSNVSTSTNCSVVCNSKTIMSYITKTVPDGSENEPFYTTVQFQTLFGLMIGAWACQAVVSSLADSICFTLLGNKPQDYGVQRLWGALGWGISAIIAGYLIDIASFGKMAKDYTPSFYLVFIILTLNTLAVSPIKVDYHHEPFSFSKVYSLFNNSRVILFLLGCITFGACIGITWQFLFWYLEDLAALQGCGSLQWIKLLQGLAMGIQCFAGEAPFLFLSGWFLNKLGHVHTMTMILIVMGIRLIAYSLLTNPWWTLPIELLQGLTLGVYWSTMASYAYLIAPPGAATTLQGIFGAVFEGIGTSIGSLLGGYIFQNYSGAAMFRFFGIFSLLVGIIYSSIHIFMDRRSSSRKDSVAGIEEFSSEESYTRVSRTLPKEEDA